MQFKMKKLFHKVILIGQYEKNITKLVCSLILIISLLIFFNYLNNEIYSFEEIRNSLLDSSKLVRPESSSKNKFFWKLILNHSTNYSINEVTLPIKDFPITNTISIDLISKNNQCHFYYRSKNGIVSGFFDSNWYLKQHLDVAKDKIFSKDPWLHYLMAGWRESRSISPYFSIPKMGTYHHSDENSFDSIPLIQYIKNIKNNEKDSHLDVSHFTLQNKNQKPCKLHDYEEFTLTVDVEYAELSSTYFDKQFYKLINPDVRLHNIEPLDHFLDYGWQESRIPNIYWVDKQKELTKLLSSTEKNSFLLSLKNNKKNSVHDNSTPYLIPSTSSIFTDSANTPILIHFKNTLSTTRIELIAWSWNLNPIFLNLFLLIAAFYLIIGFHLVNFHEKFSFTLIGNISIIFFFSLLNVIFNPPFFAPDEDYHAHSFYQIVQSDDWENNLAQEQNRLHIRRINFNASQKFDLFTIQEPFPSAFRKGGDMFERSPLTYFVWKIFAPSIQNLDVIHGLLISRCISLLFLLISVSIYFLYLRYCKVYSFYITTIPVIFLIPVVLHFSTMISDFAFASSFSILLLSFFFSSFLRNRPFNPLESSLFGILFILIFILPSSHFILSLPLLFSFLIQIFSLNSKVQSLKSIFWFFLPFLASFLFLGSLNVFSIKLLEISDLISFRIFSYSQIVYPVPNQFSFDFNSLINLSITLVDTFREFQHILSDTLPSIPNIEASGKNFSNIYMSLLFLFHLPTILIPYSIDHLFILTFWIGHGTQDLMQIYPISYIKSLISLMGVFSLSFLFCSHGRFFSKISLFSIGFICLWIVLFLGYLNGNNTQGRYLLSSYLIIYSFAGFGLLLFLEKLKEYSFFLSKLLICLLFFIWPQNIFYWLIERYFG